MRSRPGTPVDHKPKPLRLRRIPCEEVATFRRSFINSKDIVTEAQDLRNTAIEELNAAREQITREWAEHQQRMKKDLQTLDTRDRNRRIEQFSAKEIAETFNSARVLQQDFQKLEPWLAELVVTALSRIIGDIAPATRWQSLVRESMKTFRSRWGLALDCHPDDLPDLQSAIASVPDLAAAIEIVRGDPSLKPGDCVLSSATGALDIGVATQLRVLRKEITDRFGHDSSARNSDRADAPPPQADHASAQLAGKRAPASHEQKERAPEGTSGLEDRPA